MLDTNDVSESVVHLGATNYIKALIDFYNIDDINEIILGFKGKNIADIGAGFSNFLDFLSEIIGKESQFIKIDPVYSKNDFKEKILKTYNALLNNSGNFNRDLQSTIDEMNELLENVFKIGDLEKKSNINYTTTIDENQKIDLVFTINLFSNIPEPIVFLENILKKLNKNGELYIIDYFHVKDNDIAFRNLAFLYKIIRKKIFDGHININNNSMICKIKKEDFFEKYNELLSVFKGIINKKI